MRIRKNIRRILLTLSGCLGLFTVYLFQNFLDFHSLLVEWEIPQDLNYSSDYTEINVFRFTMNKVGRYILNDLFSILIIYGLFYEKKYLKFSFLVLAFGLFVLLPIYIGLYILQPEGFSSMLGHLHRVVMNPVLMLLLIPAFYYQKSKQEK